MPLPAPTTFIISQRIIQLSDVNAICNSLVKAQRTRVFAIKSQQQIDRAFESFYVSFNPLTLSKEASTKGKWNDKDKKALKAKFAEARKFRLAIEKRQAGIPFTFDNFLLKETVEKSLFARQQWDEYRVEA